MKNFIFQKDLYRWYGEQGESLKTECFARLKLNIYVHSENCKL